MKTKHQIIQQIINNTFIAIFNRWVDLDMQLRLGQRFVFIKQPEDYTDKQTMMGERANRIGRPLNRLNHWQQLLANLKESEE